jgi:hypothetical protein
MSGPTAPPVALLRPPPLAQLKVVLKGVVPFEPKLPLAVRCISQAEEEMKTWQL